MTYFVLIKKLQAHTALNPVQRRQMISAVKCFNRCFEPRGLDAPIRPIEISKILQRASAAKANISERSFSNMISMLRRALHLCSVIEQPGRHSKPLSPRWAALLPPRNTHARCRISRFFHTADRHGWDPKAITAEHFRIFHAELERGAILKKPRVVVVQAVREWNKLAEAVEEISPVKYDQSYPRPHFTLRWDQYPESFQQELQTLYQDLADPGLLSADDRLPLRPASIKTMDMRLRLFVTALVESGQKPEEITSLAQLCSLDAFKTGLKFLRDRAGKVVYQVLGVADAVYGVAKRQLKDDDPTLREIKKLLKKLRREMRQTGLSERNKMKLIQFDVRRNRDAILQLPLRLHAVAKAERASGHFSRQRAAGLMATAAAMELLLMCPMRISNLISLDLQKHVKRTVTAKSVCVHLHVPAEEVKNGIEIHCVLPEQSARLLEEYINDFRPDLPHAPSTLLFPGIKGGRRATTTFWVAISKTARRYAGLEINPHLFRHLAAKLYLDRNPGGYEVVRRMLGHKSMNTTVQFYAGQETTNTFRHFDDLIIAQRNEAADPLRSVQSGRGK